MKVIPVFCLWKVDNVAISYVSKETIFKLYFNILNTDMCELHIITTYTNEKE